ncbi:MAG: aldo/keto reductase [Clostridia bacterium]|nr:aldo/keto reductase [Clostridia bacterium]
MQKREYGNTGEMLSMIGFGGIVTTDEAQPDANRYVAEAIDAGVNYFDVAPTYGDAQEKLGYALEGKRNDVFLACKTGKRRAAEAAAALEDSLRILKTDRFDLYQLHEMTTSEEVETVLGPGGALEVLVKAKQEGKIRHIGFTAHTEMAALALLDTFDFESVLFPINWGMMLHHGFGEKVLSRAQEKGAARLAIKAMVCGLLEEQLPPEPSKYPKCWYAPIVDERHASLALRYTLSQPITAAIPPGDIRLFRLALRIAERYVPISAEEIAELAGYESGEKPLFEKL